MSRSRFPHRAALVAGVTFVLTNASACIGEPPNNTAPGTPVASNAGHYTVTIDAENAPLHRGVNDVVLHVTPIDGTSASIVSVHAWMPAHGHEAYPVSVTPIADGTFRAEGLTLNMAGEWQVDLGLSNGDTVVDDRAILWAAVE